MNAEKKIKLNAVLNQRRREMGESERLKLMSAIAMEKVEFFIEVKNGLGGALCDMCHGMIGEIGVTTRPHGLYLCDNCAKEFLSGDLRCYLENFQDYMGELNYTSQELQEANEELTDIKGSIRNG